VELVHRLSVKACSSLISSLLVSAWGGHRNLTSLSSLASEDAEGCQWAVTLPPDLQHLPFSQPGPESEAIHMEMKESWGTSR